MAHSANSPRQSTQAQLPLTFSYATIAAISFAALTFELVQTRILSFIFWNHVVYLAISIALLGFGISGTLVTVLRRARLQAPLLIGVCASLMSVSLLVALYVTSRVLPHMDAASPALKLMLCYAVSLPPFVFAGAALSLLLACCSASAGKLYFADLAAAGVACAAYFVLLPVLGAAGCLLLLSAIVTACGALWLFNAGAIRRPAAASLVALALVATTWMSIRHRHFQFLPERYKDMWRMLASGARIERTRWTPMVRIDVLGGRNSQLLNYTEHPPGSYKIITQDADAHTRLVGSAAISDIRRRMTTGGPIHPSAATYALLNHPDVAIIGTGGGVDVAYALAAGANSIATVELNPYTFDLTRRRYAGWNGNLLGSPRVTALSAEGRHAIRSTSKQFDLIQIVAIDTFAALNAGAYVLSENYLYTVEAFRDYFTHLKPGGYVGFYRWNSYPPKETLRLSSLAAQAWRRMGVDEVGGRIMIIGDERWALSVFKNGVFTPQEAETLAAQARRSGVGVLYWPKVWPAADQRAREERYYTAVNGSRLKNSADVFNALIAAYDSGNERQFFRNYAYKVTPTTDDSPFFFETSALTGPQNWDLDTLRGSSVQSTLLQISIAATLAMICAIVLPLWGFQREGLRVPHVRGQATYFAGLGFGFMLLEIALMQKCILLLGNPMYSVPILLAGLLLTAGAGSAVSARWPAPFRHKVRVTAALLVVALAMFLAMFYFAAPLVLRWPLPARAAAVLFGIAPVGFLLGIFFPTGLQFARQQAPAFVPWAWGINGCASVYGSLAATVAGMAIGFSNALLLGLASYAVAWLASESMTALAQAHAAAADLRPADTSVAA